MRRDWRALCNTATMRMKFLIIAALALTATFVQAENKFQVARPYPLKTCLIDDKKLGEQPYDFTYKGQDIKLCCKECMKDFKKDSAKYLVKIEAAGKERK
jgi:hypothetical protein